MLRHFYSSEFLDRVANRRVQEEWLAKRLGDASSFLLPVWQTRSLVDLRDSPRAVLLPAADSTELIERSRSLVLLGVKGSKAYFAADVSHGLQDPTALGSDLGGGKFVDLREVGPMLGSHDGGLLAYARGMIHWHRTHSYCGVCGSLTESLHAGHLRRCTGDTCGMQHFPRTDPAVIVLVARRGRCLLGRQSSWPKGRYSVLAGFVEPGESMEAAVRREVLEETGIELDEIRYHSSQPWPFPSSLMIGFTARALGGRLKIDHNELEHARWFTRSELHQASASGVHRLPPRIAISRQLIDTWMDAG